MRGEYEPDAEIAGFLSRQAERLATPCHVHASGRLSPPALDFDRDATRDEAVTLPAPTGDLDRLRAVFAGLAPVEHDRFRAEVAAGDHIACLLAAELGISGAPAAFRETAIRLPRDTLPRE